MPIKKNNSFILAHLISLDKIIANGQEEHCLINAVNFRYIYCSNKSTFKNSSINHKNFIIK